MNLLRFLHRDCDPSSVTGPGTVTPATSRRIRLMTGEECLEFVEGCSPEELAETQHRLNPAMTDGELDWLEKGFERGQLRVTTVSNGGKPLYRYVWHVNDQNMLHVNGSLFIGEPGQNDDWLWLIGVDMIARSQKCRGMSFETQRRGHLLQGQRAGFKVAGIRMIKTLDHAPI